MADASFATAWQRDDLDADRPGIPGTVERSAGRRAAVLPAEPAQWWRGCAFRLFPPGDRMARQRSRRAMACRVLSHVAVTTGFRIVAGVRQLSLSLARHSSRRDCCKRLAVRVQSRRLLHNAPSNRSEEHTSELQSLMRISYAVF